MEENLSLPELEVILDASRTVENRRQRFAAALKGINIDDDREEGPTGDDVRRRVEARMKGVTEEAFDLAEVGFAVEEE